MNLDFQRLMGEASRLTQVGRLRAATDAIQAALSGLRRHGPAADVDVIDIVAREVPDEPAARRAEAPRTEPPHTHAPADSFIAGHHSHAHASRDYKLFIPPQAAGTAALPLVVMLHGCTQDPDDFAAGTAMNELARREGFYVLYPAQSQKANPQRCWSWFKHNHQGRRGEPALLADMTRAVMSQHAIDPARVYVAGLSAGGAMAAILGDAYPELYAAVGVHSGLAAGAARDLPSALAAMTGGGQAGAATVPNGVPTIVFHGDADATVHAINGEQVVQASAGSNGRPESERKRPTQGRAFTRRVHRDANGQVTAEHWLVHGAAHAWSGGSPNGTYTDPQGPDASAEMFRFFMAHPRTAP